MNDADTLRRLAAELDNEYKFIVRCGSNLAKFSDRWNQGVDDEIALIAVAYELHNTYNAFEAYFLRVSKHFENHLPPHNWHAELLQKMTLDIPGIRKALLDESFGAELDELRRFRHVFRNLYKSVLKPEHVRLVLSTGQEGVKRFVACHKSFRDWLDALIRSEDL